MNDGPRKVTRVSAYAVCTDEAGRVLLARIAPGYTTTLEGWWTLPGGGLEHGEEPSDGALRELQEETGLIGEVIELLDVASWHSLYTNREGQPEDHHGVRILYRCRIVGGQLRVEIGGSTDDCRWFAASDLPRDRLTDIAELATRHLGLD